ncbi:B-cell receptor CD22-like [Sardina pilchardus]|uniref:B-cell receptor CD22-like n=1 Tax=Sardina pilchardus TaxID=27697 RepID=UPI002E1035FC
MSTTKGPVILTAAFWLLSGVLGEGPYSVMYSSSSICGLKGSFVDIPCTYSYPSGKQVREAYWFIKWRQGREPDYLNQDSRYQGRVEYLGDKVSDCTLRIKDLRETDIDEKYRFRCIINVYKEKFAGSEVSLTLTDLRVTSSPVSVRMHDSLTLTCSTTCSLSNKPTYIWYRNSQPLSNTHTTSSHIMSIASFSKEDAGSYSCAVRGHEDHPSPSVCLSGWSVTYTTQSICALKGSSVELHSYYTYPCDHTVMKAFWYITGHKDLREDEHYQGRVDYTGNNSNNHTLTIRNLNLDDAKTYTFRFVTDKEVKFSNGYLRLLVTELQVLVNPDTVKEGDEVTLTCNTTCSLSTNPTYIWYKNSQPIDNPHTADNRLYIHSASPEDAGKYSCAVKGQEIHSSPEMTQDIRYAPRNTSASLSPSGDLHEGDSVTLTCSSDANPPVHTYTWYRKTGDETVLQDTGRMLSFSLNLVTDVDELYHCEAQNEVGSENSTGVRVSLPGPGLPKAILFSALVGILVIALLSVAIVCWRRQETQSTKTSMRIHSNTQGHSDPVYGNISTIPLASGCGQRVPADHKDDEDDIQYASVQFKPNKQWEVPSQEEDVQYASVQFKKSRPESNIPEPPLSDTSQEETQYSLLTLQGLSAATQTGAESVIYSNVNTNAKP